MEQKIKSGYIKLYVGPMFSGKTTSILEAYTRHSIGGRKCILVKYENDNRYSKSQIVTHSKIESNDKNIINCKYLHDIEDIIQNYDVICIDEVQFYEDADIFCDKWANEGKIIEACGLIGTYSKDYFEVMARLLPKAESIIFKKAVCKSTGKNASFTLRKIEDDRTILIGSDDMYDAVDRETYNKLNKKALSDNFKKYIEYKSAKTNQQYDVDKCIMMFNETNDKYDDIMDICKKIENSE